MPYWKRLGSGSYNDAYVDEFYTLVFKRQKIFGCTSDYYDAPKRSVRIWNSINPGIPAMEAATTSGDLEAGGTAAPVLGWQCQYVHGRQAEDVEIARELIDIFNRSGRIVLDAFVKNNFITQLSGRVVCVDVGLGVELDMRDAPIRDAKGTVRRPSIISIDAWNNEWPVLLPVMQKNEKTFQATIHTLYALLLVKFYRPDLLDVTFLKYDEKLTSLLAKGFKGVDKEKALSALDETVKRHHRPTPELALATTKPLTKAKPHASEVTISAAPIHSHHPLRIERTFTKSEKCIIKRGIIPMPKPTPLLVTPRYEVVADTKITVLSPAEAYLRARKKEESLPIKYTMLRHGLFANPLKAVPADAALLPLQPMAALAACKAGR